MKGILYREDENARLWITHACRMMDDMLHKADSNGLALTGWRTIYVEPKDGGRPFYIAVDSVGKPRFDANDIYDMDIKRVAYLMELEADADILAMAETRKVPRMV